MPLGHAHVVGVAAPYTIVHIIVKPGVAQLYAVYVYTYSHSI